MTQFHVWAGKAGAVGDECDVGRHQASGTGRMTNKIGQIADFEMRFAQRRAQRGRRQIRVGCPGRGASCRAAKSRQRCRVAILSRLADLPPCRDIRTPNPLSTRVNNSVVDTGGPGRAVTMPKTFNFRGSCQNRAEGRRVLALSAPNPSPMKPAISAFGIDTKRLACASPSAVTYLRWLSETRPNFSPRTRSFRSCSETRESG